MVGSNVGLNVTGDLVGPGIADVTDLGVGVTGTTSELVEHKSHATRQVPEALVPHDA